MVGDDEDDVIDDGDVRMGLVADDEGSAGADVEEESCGKCTGC